jgi:predicted phage-related endonuclease
MRVLVETKDLSKDEWLEYRKQGIGGSDSSVIAGVNKYKSPLVLYMEKVGLYTQPVEGEAAYWGNTLEDVVAQEFIKRYNMELFDEFIRDGGEPTKFKKAKIQRRNAILMHDVHDFILMNLDRILLCPRRGKGIVEVKTASQYVADEWKGEDVPNPYYVQVQQYLGISGYKFAYIAVLIGGNQFKMYYIERDDEFIESLFKLECDFWNKHVLPQIPPEVDGHDSTVEMYKLMNPLHFEGRPPLELPAIAMEWAEGAQEAKAELEAWKTRKQECENKLKDAMKDNPEAFAGSHKITWKTSKNGARPMLIKLDAVKK